MVMEVNGISYKIPDGQVVKIMQGLKVSAQEAGKIWLEDEGKMHNAEQEALCKKAKDSGVIRTIHQATSKEVIDKKMSNSDKPKNTKPKTTKDNPTKEKLIFDIAELLQNCCENVTITNKSKLIEFSLDGHGFKLDLTQKRK